jgi:hypothetical protein
VRASLVLLSPIIFIFLFVGFANGEPEGGLIGGLMMYGLASALGMATMRSLISPQGDGVAEETAPWWVTAGSWIVIAVLAYAIASGWNLVFRWPNPLLVMLVAGFGLWVFWSRWLRKRLIRRLHAA